MNYDRDFKIQAIQLSDDIGVKKASEQLGIPYHTLADWRWQRALRSKLQLRDIQSLELSCTVIEAVNIQAKLLKQ